MKPIIACLFALACSPAIAGSYDFAIDGMIKDIDLDLWGNATVHTPADPRSMWFFNGRMGHTLEEMQASSGGTIMAGPEHQDVDAYLCFRNAGVRIIYLADDGVIDWIVAEPANSKTDTHYGCTDQPTSYLGLHEGYPELGATMADLEAHFGVDLADGTDREIFHIDEEFESYSSVRNIYYRLKDGVVDGISLAYGEYR